MADQPFLSVIMPVYNEARTLEEILRRVQAVPLEKEIVAVNDFSTDGSGPLLDRLAAASGNLRVIHQPRNRGKGAAIRTAIPLCRGRIILIQDADLEVNPAEYPHLIQPILEGQADVVYGSRFLDPSSPQPLWHTLGNKLLTVFSNLFTGLDLTDMETCYKVFRADVIQRMRLRSDRFGFEPEVTSKIAKMNCRVHELPISYNGRGYAEGKKINWKDGMSALWTIARCGLTPLKEEEKLTKKNSAGAGH